MEQIIKIAEFVLRSFIHIWPYLLVTIPLAVIINLSGASRYIKNAFGNNPILSVLLATIVGAFSPFCSCGVIPVISSLLIGGVPLAPVMSFWIASPSMDPEIFFLSTSMIGRKLAVWRLASTFAISLIAGYITHFATVKGFIGSDILLNSNKKVNHVDVKTIIGLLKSFFNKEKVKLGLIPIGVSNTKNLCCEVEVVSQPSECDCSCQTAKACNTCDDTVSKNESLQFKNIVSEITKATIMVAKFMGLAFVITALLNFYVPKNLIEGIVSSNPTVQVILSTLIGVPMYTSNITALPLVGGLLDMGLNKGAALAFLIGGATTTLPAMVAVWGITKKRVFFLYISFALFGALFAGLIFNLFN